MDSFTFFTLPNVLYIYFSTILKSSCFLDVIPWSIVLPALCWVPDGLLFYPEDGGEIDVYWATQHHVPRR
jgi:hypothetical protein